MTRHRSHHQDQQQLYYEKLADEVISRSAKVLEAKEEEWEWGDYVATHDGSIRVSLANAGVRDADLESLCLYLMRTWEEAPAGRFPNGCDLTIDLSCNCGISDYGIIVHLVPFLRSWPSCRRLKLYQTSVGDRALEALTPWIAKGYAHEVHLSDLNGEVTPGVVLKLLKAIHSNGHYPFWKTNGGRAPLWLRLEHNRLPNPDDLVAQARAAGVSIRILGRAELSSVRPGDDLRKRGQDNPEVILVLFKLQQGKELVQDECVEQTRDLLNMLGKTLGPGDDHSSPDDEPGGHISGRGARRRAGRGGGGIGGKNETAPKLASSEPQPLSVDEFRLWEMQAREDKEGGADKRNWETFGADVGKGWTFEENLKANAWLARRAARASREWRRWNQQGWGNQMETPVSYDQTGGDASAWVDDLGQNSGYCGQMEYVCAASSTAGATMGSRVQVAKTEIEDAISRALFLIPTLQRADFDGQVKQYLHAIRTQGGPARVMDAIQAIRAAMAGKTRSSVRRWPAYLVALLKRFHSEQTKQVMVVKSVVTSGDVTTGVLATDGATSPSGPGRSGALDHGAGTRRVATSDASAASAMAGLGANAIWAPGCGAAEAGGYVAPMGQHFGGEDPSGAACGTGADARALSAEISGHYGLLQ
mmetsp:Transcript_134103/g.388171  ORF Transcript_134103/g.388171 Transcript_134103/m.388171 type:complete len:646 (+) Transcript_134103:174-2111(+)